MKRHDDWPERLSAALERYKSVPFSWGSHDCVYFAAKCIFQMTGHNTLEDLNLGNYTTPIGAARQIKKLGFNSLEEAVESVLPVIERPRRGDVALCDAGEGQPFLAVVVGEKAVGVSEEGYLFVPRSQFIKSFRVGE